jgi:hypothetical protein
VLKSGYIPFTGVNTNNTVSAEMYCSTDVLHYDNYDFVNPVANGQTYYCVAFNAHTTVTPPTCGEHEHLDGDQCVPDVVVPPTCETGTHLEGEVCVPDVVVPPTCETGMHLEGETCVPDDVGPGVCAVGTHPEQTTPEVSVPFAPNQCAEGLTLTDGQCVAASSAPTCSAGAYNAETNQCEDVSNVEVPATPAICGTGVLNTATDMCEVASVAPTCPENAPNVEGMCTPVAEESETICVPDVVVPPTCETGTHLEGETCVADAPTPAVDVCANLEGDQLEVPSGMNIVNGDQCKTKSRRNGGSSSGRSNGQVLGAATTTEPTLPQGCIPLLNAYLRFGWNNDSEEVKKLQNFLNEHMGLNLPVSGFFGPMTLEAVKSLQTKYWEQILQPWFSFNGSGITGQGSATGFVYQTTKWYINNLSCTDLNAPLPELQ